MQIIKWWVQDSRLIPIFFNLSLKVKLEISKIYNSWFESRCYNNANHTKCPLLTNHPRLTTLSRPETRLHSNLFLKIKALIKKTMNWFHSGHPFVRSFPKPRDIYSCCRSFGTETVTTCYLGFLQPGFRYSAYRMHGELSSQLKIVGNLAKDLISFTKANKIWLRFNLYCLWIKFICHLYC